MIGVINFDTASYIEITDIAKQELSHIAVAVSNFIDLTIAYKVNQKSKENIKAAIKNLETQLSLPLPALTKPKIFLASSGRAETDVIEAIIETLDKYATQMELIFWKEDMNAPGNIHQQLIATIKECRYGICYFSEPNESKEGWYQDNFNVIFEAGMFQGRIVPVNWIPIREVASPKIPFDFAQSRILNVPREEEGTFKKEYFSSSLIEMINAMLAMEAPKE